jgi:hypothetical protein
MRFMGAVGWVSTNWFELLQSIGIVTGLLLTAYARRMDATARKISNFLAITERHQALWNQMHERPELDRILDEKATLDKTPVSFQEQRFVTLVAIHVDSVHRAMKSKMFPKMEGWQKDVKEFFSLPIPRVIWAKVKHLHNRDFVEFVESSIK